MARTVQLYDEPNWVGYAVEMPVFPDVVASGILLLPRDLKPGERRPVVVCQHGLEGRPRPSATPRSSRSIMRSAPSWLTRVHRLRTPESLHRPRTISVAPAQAEPAQAVPLLGHRPPARTDTALAGESARGRPRPDCLLRPIVRRQDGDARAGDPRWLLPLDLLGRLQRVGRQDTTSTGPKVTCLRTSTICTSSAWPSGSTTPRWPA